jgi:hypothetical protein
MINLKYQSYFVTLIAEPYGRSDVTFMGYITIMQDFSFAIGSAGIRICKNRHECFLCSGDKKKMNSDIHKCFFFYLNIGGWSPYWVHSALRPLLAYCTCLGLGDCEDREVGGMNGFGRGNRSTWRKPAPMPLCPPQIPLARPGHEPGPPRWEASD